MVVATQVLGAPPVAKERKKSDDRQITFRISLDLHSRLEAAAGGLELDISSLLRKMIRKHLPDYEEEAEAIRRRESQSRKED